MADYYIDTTVVGPGSGTQIDPWKNISYAWTRFSAGSPAVVYCTGGNDIVTANLSIANMPATSLTIIGNWSHTNLNQACYKIKSNIFSLFYVASKSLTFKNVLIENGVDTAPANTETSILCTAGILAIENSGIIFNAGGTNTVYWYGIRVYGASATVKLINSIIQANSIAGPAANGSSRLTNIQNDCTSVISGCIIHPGPTASFPFIASGNINNSATPAYTNCSIAGPVVAAAFNYSNATGFQNCSSSVSNTTISRAIQDTFWANPNNGDFTPVEPPPIQIKDVGTNYSATIGNSLDINGNDRSNTALAGAAWDRGPYEYGFGAPFAGTHTVTDISQITDPDCIYYGQTVGGRTVQVGDKVSFDTATQTNAWPVDIDSQGFPIVDSGGSFGSDSFKFNMAAGTSGVWEPEPPAYATWLFTIAAADPDITTTALGAMTDQQAFSQTLAATGTAPMTWDVLAGSLPPGLSLSSAGVLSGTVAGYGAYDFTARVTNAVSTDSQQYTGTVAAALPVVLTTSLPAAYDTGAAYSHQLIASGSTPITWTLTGGALPAGITLSINGLLSGGTTVEPATFSPQFTATNPAGSNAKTLTLQVLEGTPPVSGPGNALGGIPLSVTGQWLITANPIDHYYLGHPVSATGALVTSADEAVARWHNGLPHIDSGAVAIDDLAIVSSWLSGLPLTSAGKVAVAMASVAYWAGGVPFTSTGRVAVSTA